MRIQTFGFESVDQNPHLLETFPIVSVMKGDVDLMQIEANEFPSRLGRALRKEIFGQNGLVETMISLSIQLEKRQRALMLSCFLVRFFKSNKFNQH